MAIARHTIEIETAIGMGAPQKLDSSSTIRITPAIRNMIAQMGVSEAEWIASAKRRAAGGDALSETTLGRKVRIDSGDERAVGMPTGFRNV